MPFSYTVFCVSPVFSNEDLLSVCKKQPLLLSVVCILGYFYEITLASNFLDVTQWKRQDQLELHLFQYSKTSFESSSYTYKVVLFNFFFFADILLRMYPTELHGVLLHGPFLCIGRTMSVTIYYIKDLTF